MFWGSIGLEAGGGGSLLHVLERVCDGSGVF